MEGKSNENQDFCGTVSPSAPQCSDECDFALESSPWLWKFSVTAHSMFKTSVCLLLSLVVEGNLDTQGGASVPKYQGRKFRCCSGLSWVASTWHLMTLSHVLWQFSLSLSPFFAFGVESKALCKTGKDYDWATPPPSNPFVSLWSWVQ